MMVKNEIVELASETKKWIEQSIKEPDQCCLIIYALDSITKLIALVENPSLEERVAKLEKDLELVGKRVGRELT